MVEKIVEEKIEQNLEAPEQIQDNMPEASNIEMPNMAQEAERVLEKAKANESKLSEETKEKVKKVGFFAKLFQASPEKIARKNAEALEEIMAHPNLKMGYEEAVEKGRGEMYIDAYRRLGTPFYWNAEEERYQGQPWQS